MQVTEMARLGGMSRSAKKIRAVCENLKKARAASVKARRKRAKEAKE